MRTTLVLLATALGLTLALPRPPAHAGAYYARACHADGLNSMWAASATAGMTAYAQCPGGLGGSMGLYARNVVSPTPAGGLSNAGFTVAAPPGTYFDEVHLVGKLLANPGWQAGILDRQSGRWLWCGPGCAFSGSWIPIHVGGFASTSIQSMVICGAAQCGSQGQIHGEMGMHDVTLRVQDTWNPEVSITGGPLASDGWRSGSQSVDVAASDNAGIRQLRAVVDGAVLSNRGLACDDRFLAPCPNKPSASLNVDLGRLADGPHRLDVQAIDAGGNAGSAGRTILVDNRAPDPPVGLATAVDRWSSEQAFDLSWSQPPGDAGSPVRGAVYQLCPEVKSLRCSSPAESAGNRLNGLKVREPGAWRVKVWLIDQAGNQNSQTARETVVRWDPDPPTVRLAPRDESDPARIRVIASDAVSGIAKSEIEVRRQGAATWHSLAVASDERGFSAMVDDERLKKGTYAVRARATDQAGNVRSVDGANVTLPIRLATRLRVGRVKRVGHGGALQKRPRVAFGHVARLSGRLTSPGGNPLAGRDVEVAEMVDSAGAQWRPTATLRTGKSGRFSFKAPAGPSRRLRFRYPGTATIRGRTASVHLRVRASSTMTVDRHRAVNGEAVMFRGRVRGGSIPPTGKLLQLQVFSRGAWLTFATPRTDADGVWQHEYRFTATRGLTRYRFRVRIPRESGFPYDSGSSPTARVEVVGL